MSGGTVARGFHWADYVVFAVVLLFSAGIGLYHAFAGGRQRTTGEYLMGNRNMRTVPVSLSILVSFISAILVLGTPAEMYTKGTMYMIYPLGMSLSCVLVTVLIVPLLWPLKLTSSYEYLELRFRSKTAKLMGTIILMTSEIIYMGIAVYSPATALEAASGGELKVWMSIVVVGIVSTFYTTLGGMKAVVWTDVFQTIVMVGGLLAIVITGASKVGGLANVWEINRRDGRIEFFDFDMDPTKRHTFWGLILGGGSLYFARYGVNQASVQRFCALPTMKQSKWAVMLLIPGQIFIFTLVCMAGITIYAFYAEKGCDPLRNKEISNSNQLVPLFVMEALNYPGFPGLFIATLFSGALSTMSSTLNALSAVTWEDFLKWKYHDMPEIKQTVVTKALVVFYGCVGIGSAFMAQQFGGTVLQAALSFTGAALGPLLGLFLLGGLFPWANWKGAVGGGLVGLAFSIWISVGAYASPPYRPNLPTRLDNCPVFHNGSWVTNRTIIDWLNITTTPEPTGIPIHKITGIDRLYTVSYLWYSAIGASTAVVVGLIISCLTGFSRAAKTESKYLMKLGEWACCCLPEKTVECCQCGANYDEEDKELVNDGVQVFQIDGATNHLPLPPAPGAGVTNSKDTLIDNVDRKEIPHPIEEITRF